ncbi:MAG: PEP-CTERM sorting domain-containing protein [Planctomycetota bacterium]
MVTSSSEAGVISPAFSRFGSLPQATFGGTGIPNDAVAITEFTVPNGGPTFTLGLTATPRFFEPAVSNNGAGTFQAAAGGFPGAPSLARWNFGFFAEVSSGPLANYQVDLLYDLDPAADTPESDLGVINLTAALAGSGDPRVEGSQNLGFPFLAANALPVIDAPTFTAFDPAAAGEYTFALSVANAGEALGQVSILVNTVPEPASALGIACVMGVLATSRRRRSSSL